MVNIDQYDILKKSALPATQNDPVPTITKANAFEMVISMLGQMRKYTTIKNSN